MVPHDLSPAKLGWNMSLCIIYLPSFSPHLFHSSLPARFFDYCSNPHSDRFIYTKMRKAMGLLVGNKYALKQMVLVTCNPCNVPLFSTWVSLKIYRAFSATAYSVPLLFDNSQTPRRASRTVGWSYGRTVQYINNMHRRSCSVRQYVWFFVQCGIA